MMKNIAVIGMAVLLIGALANAAPVDGDFPGERYVLEVTKTAGVGTCECLDRYTFTVLDQGSGMPVNAVEVNVTGPGVHQEQYDDDGDPGTALAITPDLSHGYGISPIDTTILLDWTGVPGFLPNEPVIDPLTSCEPASGTFKFMAFELGATGYGSPLTGTVFTTPAVATPLDVLQVVLKCGTTADFTILASNAAGEGEAFVGTIPEPATLGLLCLGGLALIRRRR